MAAGQTNSEIKEVHTLYSETIFHVGSFPVTNSFINSFLVLLIVLTVSWKLKSSLKLVPGKIQSIFESVIDGLLDIFDSVTSSRSKTLKFFPIVFAFFIFILLNNWLGIIPGVGSIGKVISENGENVFVPYFRGGTADLNTTLALASVGVVLSHVFSVFFIGGWKYLNKFVNLKALIEIPSKVMKDPTVLIINPIKVFVGFLEIIGEVAKVASLSFRLFGNIFAGEVLLASMAAILAFGLPIPFMFLEVMVGAIQALIFAMLTLTYLTMMTTAEEH